MRLCVDLLALIFCMLFAFWVLIFVYFPRLGKLSYYLSIFLLTFLPFLFLRFLYCNCDCNWWCCWIPLTNSNYLFFSFHSGWSFPLLCLPAHSSILLPLLIYYLFPLLYIQFLLLNYLALIFLNIFFLFLEFLTEMAHSCLKSNILMTITSNSLIVLLPISDSFNSFGGVLSCYLICDPFLSLLILSHSVCFYVSESQLCFLILRVVAYRVTVVSYSSMSQVHQNGMLQWCLLSELILPMVVTDLCLPSIS